MPSGSETRTPVGCAADDVGRLRSGVPQHGGSSSHRQYVAVSSAVCCCCGCWSQTAGTGPASTLAQPPHSARLPAPSPQSRDRHTSGPRSSSSSSSSWRWSSATQPPGYSSDVTSGNDADRVCTNRGQPQGHKSNVAAVPRSSRSQTRGLTRGDRRSTSTSRRWNGGGQPQGRRSAAE